MMDREYKFVCDDCGSSFMIISDQDEAPICCPFCGKYLDEDDEDE